MNARFHLPIVALCIAGALAGCASVTQGTQFQPPTGWGGIPAIMGRLQMWFKKGQNKGDVQFLMLVKTNPKDNNSDFSQIEASTNTKDLKVLSHGPTKFCGSQPGEQFSAEGTNSGDGQKMTVEMTSSVIGNDKYVAVYMHPSALPADKQAETSIRSLCPVAK